MSDYSTQELGSTLQEIVAKFKEELRGIRSNRPSVELLENVKVNYFDSMMLIKQLGSLSVQLPRDIMITVWDKNAVGAVMKAIEGAKVGYTVTNNDNVIRASLPQITDERREEFAKIVKKMAEQARIQIRGKREESNKKIKAAEEAKELNEDQAFKAKEEVQKEVDETNAAIEALLKGKLGEISE